MTFHEIERSLPNGFHDASVSGIDFDALGRTVTLTISVHVSEVGEFDRERYRTLFLIARDVKLFFLEPPDARYPFVLDGEGIDASGDEEFNGLDQKTEDLMARLPASTDRYRFFLSDWNSFLYLGAEDASYRWE